MTMQFPSLADYQHQSGQDSYFDAAGYQNAIDAYNQQISSQQSSMPSGWTAAGTTTMGQGGQNASQFAYVDPATAGGNIASTLSGAQQQLKQLGYGGSLYNDTGNGLGGQDYQPGTPSVDPQFQAWLDKNGYSLAGKPIDAGGWTAGLLDKTGKPLATFDAPDNAKQAMLQSLAIMAGGYFGGSALADAAAGAGTGAAAGTAAGSGGLSSADAAALYGNAGYGAGATSAELAGGAGSAAAGGASAIPDTSGWLASSGNGMLTDAGYISPGMGTAADTAATTAAGSGGLSSADAAALYGDTGYGAAASPAELASAGGGGSWLDTAGNWLSKFASGDATTLGQARMGLGALGLLNSVFQSQSPRNQINAGQMQGMLKGPYDNWTTPGRAAAAGSMFNKDLSKFNYVPPTVFTPQAAANPRVDTAAFKPVGLARGGAVGHARGCGCHMCSGGSVGFASGGALSSMHDALVRGDAGGQADNVPARLSPGEYVMDADVVSALGDGNNAAGARKLDEMRHSIRAHNRSAPPGSIPPQAKSPLAYMKGGRHGA